MTFSENILRSLKERGHKVTKNRSFIVGFLAENRKPFSAGAILSEAAKTVRKFNKTTIYRELDFLKKEEVISEIEFGDGKKRYEIAGLPHHHHAVCTVCEKVEDVILDEDLEKVERKILRDKKFKVKNHLLEFFGLCKNCAYLGY
ncbi:MAG: Fur family transcriptional regulator [bacterium]|nr:Fur family transcriptional regulator [bacterium]